MKPGLILRLCMLLTLSMSSGICLAGIQVGGTRIIFPASDREASIQVSNLGAEDIMIQAWIEAEPGHQQADVPFAVTPSLARLGHRKQQTLRIFYQGKGLVQDRESVVWLSIQEIPQVSDANNSLQVAFRQRLKLFYRPQGLPGNAEESAKQLQWAALKAGNVPALQAINDTAFHVSLAQVRVLANHQEYAVESAMVGPHDTRKMIIKGLPSDFSGVAQVRWESINDYGALEKHSVSLQF
ncbi:fimbrial biogenesis chaperone [Pseudomonas sessilinigenes]|uniref:Molecular chaperone n=2 Tax=Pseudomonas TaxID=286 RepID=A0ABX8MWC3_9PSED|nr:molecular chaperone [Pseudomonas sessilinigenes]AZC24606.1 putative pili asembly chaperone [Pseudomonas sessilinigenes]QIH08273.1 molecular chaperone [Pseudomonas sp. BIOMIG1BAC]QXH43535.1 molecular chaperone [Pseudomonas sessilinigenes]